MAARSLVQALEGVQFPCDRSRLIEYARRQEIGRRSLDALEAIPDREYHDLNELFTALPSKQEISRRRAAVIPSEHHAEAEEAYAQDNEAQSSQELAEQEGAGQPALHPVDVAMLWWSWGLETWSQGLRLTQQMWFPWMRP